MNFYWFAEMTCSLSYEFILDSIFFFRFKRNKMKNKEILHPHDQNSSKKYGKKYISILSHVKLCLAFSDYIGFHISTKITNFVKNHLIFINTILNFVTIFVLISFWLAFDHFLVWPRETEVGSWNHECAIFKKGHNSGIIKRMITKFELILTVYCSQKHCLMHLLKMNLNYLIELKNCLRQTCL